MYIGTAREREHVCKENADGNERKSVLSGARTEFQFVLSSILIK